MKKILTVLAPLVSTPFPAVAEPAEEPGNEANLEEQETQLALKGLDPLALIDGIETPGSPEYSWIYQGFEYRFAKRGSLKLFRSNPEQYAIQLEGACAAMPGQYGASSEIFLVYAGRIYIFGSEACRTHFSAEPESTLQRHENFAAEG